MLTLDDRIADRLRSVDYKHWRDQVAATGGCAAPLRMSGSWALTDTASGAVLAGSGGDILVPCGNRRASICQPCADRYAADAFHLLRAGLTGGSKGVPESVSTKPRAFVTLTAPSFGAVHNRPTTRAGIPRRCACGQRHHIDDPRVGTAIDVDTYDYTGHVLWQNNVGALWHRFTITLRRTIATTVGLKVREISEQLRISYAKVAEYQRRGIVHFHAVIRLDGPDGATSPAPAWATNDLLVDCVRRAARACSVTPRGVDFTLVWGRQVDIRPILPTSTDPDDRELTEASLSGYIAKYATKGSGKSEATDRPIRSQIHLDDLDVSQHHRRIMQTCWDLGDTEQHPELAGMNLRKWTHMLGFRGHFLTKSHHYSTTFTLIRGERRTYQTRELITRLGHDPETVTLVNDWTYTGTGHNSDAERELAAGIAAAHHVRKEAR